jgi:hypothetical protein
MDFYSALSLKQLSTDRHVAPLGHIILIPTRLCSFVLMLQAQLRSNKYQFFSLWFDSPWAQTTCSRHDIIEKLELKQSLTNAVISLNLL